jgi:WD40 repeat protein
MCAGSSCLIAVLTSGGLLQFFSRDGKFMQELKGFEKVSGLAFHPDKPGFLFVWFSSGTVRVWNIQLDQEVSSFKAPKSHRHVMRIMPDNRVLLSGEHSAEIVTLDQQSKLLSTVHLIGSEGFVYDIVALPNSDMCITGHGDSSIKVWDNRTGNCLRTLTEHSETVEFLSAHSNGSCFASASEDQSAIVWSTNTFEMRHQVYLDQWPTGLAFGLSDAFYVGVAGKGVLKCSATSDFDYYTDFSGAYLRAYAS